MAFTTADLIASVERRSFSPTGQLTFEEEEILAIGDEEVKTQILPNILAVREEFFVFPHDTTITAGLTAINIHPRAAGMVVRHLQILDGNNNVTDIPRIEPEEISSYAQGGISGFYLRGDQIIFDRVPSSASGTLRQLFHLRPGKMVLTSAAAVISNINTGTNAITVTSIPSTWASGNIFDFIKKDGAHGYRAIEYTSTDVTSNVITFSSLPSDIVVGDYMALAGESPLVQMPPDYQPVLAQCIAATILENQNQPGAKKARERAEALLTIAQKMVTPRVVGVDRVIQPTNWW